MLTLFWKEGCGPCSRAKKLLESKGVTYISKNVAIERHKQYLNERGLFTVPQIFLDDVKYVESWRELQDIPGEDLRQL